MAYEDIYSKIRVQEIIEKNSTTAVGDFHSDNFDCDAFICDINKNFKLTPNISSTNVDEVLEKIIKSSTIKVRGRFNSKEIKKSKLLKELFINFKLEML